MNYSAGIKYKLASEIAGKKSNFYSVGFPKMLIFHDERKVHFFIIKGHIIIKKTQFRENGPKG
jgi:hypothetical protein